MPTGQHPAISVTVPSDADLPCAHCGYNLRGTVGQACPECGTPFVLHAPEQTARYGWYLVALCLTAGLVLKSTGLLYELFYYLFDRDSFWFEGWLYPAVHFIYMLSVPYFIVLLVLRRNIIYKGWKLQVPLVIPPLIGVLFECVIVVRDLQIMFF